MTAKTSKGSYATDILSRGYRQRLNITAIGNIAVLKTSEVAGVVDNNSQSYCSFKIRFTFFEIQLRRLYGDTFCREYVAI